MTQVGWTNNLPPPGGLVRWDRYGLFPPSTGGVHVMATISECQ